jgi:hypothetical protein
MDELEATRAGLKKVVNAVPDDLSSPVLALAPDISQAVFRVAPEKAERLQAILDNVRLVFKTDDGAFDFSAGPAESGKRSIFASVGALNALWCASYAYWLLYCGCVGAQRAGRSEFQPRHDPNLIQALQLYEWALSAISRRVLEPWPEIGPNPLRCSTDASDIRVANEIFLVAAAWIMLHEIGHIKLKHPVAQVRVRAKQEEKDADRFATEWVLSGVADPIMLLKRSLGIAVANILLLVVDLGRTASVVHPSFDTSHPPSYERVHDNLRNDLLAEGHPVHAFATALLQATLAVFGVPHNLDLDGTFSTLLDELCISLSRFNHAQRNQAGRIYE